MAALDHHFCALPKVCGPAWLLPVTLALEFIMMNCLHWAMSLSPFAIE